jgi:hypothetical protein
MSLGLAAFLGDVVAYGMDTRFLQSGVLLRYGGNCVAAIWFCGGDDASDVVVCRPAPDASVDWLAATPIELPAVAPTRLAIDTAILDRSAIMHVDVEALALTGTALPAWGERARWAVYTSLSGHVACVLESEGRSCGVWHGPRLEAFDYDNLGSGVAS